jgi:acetyl-CoA carboxylase/biotin carboxylase 1
MADNAGQALAVVAVAQPSPDGSGATQHVLRDVIGLEDGLGVECLSGSGAIAAAYAKVRGVCGIAVREGRGGRGHGQGRSLPSGHSSGLSLSLSSSVCLSVTHRLFLTHSLAHTPPPRQAFRHGYTITLVSGRTVGIGAYLARLGRRCVQRSDQPIILTGFSALNKLLGREVYTSQMQLGGPRVMGHNGVSHHVVRDDLEGVSTVLRLLSFAPATIGAPPPLLPSCDPVTRAVTYAPGPGEKLDPRAAIAGCFATPLVPDAPQSLAGGGNQSAAGWQSGLFDRASWVESHAGWAGTVVTGRARLGGQPVGVIAVETATTTRHQPADPGMPDSSEQNIPQAGQVWYPDSAQKTALAMEEFGLEGLPLFVLANWRGFSGGQRDLFEGVLQAGSLIVEQLRTYRQPVFVYLPANAELRGGAWVVVDSQINAACVEMYADPTARGGVLEPAGVVEIKFRKPDLLRMMGRLDPVLQRARAEGDTAGASAREKALLPVYQQVARTFADMHDTPQRMLAKGVIRSIVPWRVSRAFFGMRLRRRLMEETLANHIQSTDASIERADALSLVRSWHASAKSSPDTWATSSGPTSPDPVLRQPTPPSSSLGQGGAESTSTRSGSVPPLMLPSGTDPSSPFAVQMASDAEFLAWAESSGRTLIAQELRQLRSRAAACTVHQVLGTAEGREGLLATLTAAARGDAVLAMQLRMALAEAAEGGGGQTGSEVGGGGSSSSGRMRNLTINTSGSAM